MISKGRRTTARRPDLVTSIASALRRAFVEQRLPEYGTSGIGQAFFRVWMKDRGHAFFFLFRKNLKVTNIQFTELLALVSSYTTDRLTQRPVHSLQFVSSNDFASTVHGIVDSFSATTRNPTQLANRVAAMYTHVLQHTVVVDTFFGSCSVYFPPHLQLDLQSVCGLSGYIHSCGRNVFVRNVAKATQDHLFEALRRYLRRYPSEARKRLFFTAYAHEDFTDYDDEHRPDLTHGLDDVKIHVEKFFMNGVHLVAVLKGVREKFKQLAIPDPGDFRDQHTRLRTTSDIDQDRTLWLIADYGVAGPVPAPSEDRYFICYDQLYDNKNPYQIFDENKPAWIEHTTIPHTLMSAMINITMPYWESTRVVIGDPFVGTGTTWLESAKHPQVDIDAGDIDPLACLAARDNAQFFALDARTIRRFADIIMRVALELQGRRDRIEKQHAAALAGGSIEARLLADRVREWIGLRPDQLEERARKVIPKEEELVHRLLGYLSLRTHKRHAPGLSRGSEEWSKAFMREVSTLCPQMYSLAALKARESRLTMADGTLSVCQGSYSQSVTVAEERISRLCEQARDGSVPGVRDARQLTRNVCGGDGYDVLVTDPPYAFNTDEGPEQLGELYTAFLRAAIRNLTQLPRSRKEFEPLGQESSMFLRVGGVESKCSDEYIRFGS